ncbi:vacuolar protein-sorting-associated protein 33 homolog isoform X3 [Cryptomeria japonica]|uniref:vacuolar protein-sorting-associated protein 33 homolog isoform X3 n=1 Tax=Cryptomeria japonica TaxID=3369 RepID=UPI0025AD0F36|nr:vacuolar protein-sorting-associated protein 33 homolog isoform X3 [Cryptomeria japonica]
MAQIPKLDNAPINISPFRDQSRKELVNILNTIRGKKTLYLDPKLSGSLALILQTSLLKEHGVENLGHLSTNPIQSDCKNVLYLVRPQINLMKLISAQIQQDVRQNYQREYTVIFVPRRTVVCEKSAFGVIPNVRVKGKAATIVADILSRMQLEQPVVSSNAGIPEIDTLILLDRHVDMVTPMCSQLTYEGLLDEFLHINNGAIELDASIMGAQEEGKKAKVPLNSSDKLYREIRDLNFGVVGQVLRQKATTMRQDYTEVTTTSQTVSELKDFVKKLSSLPEMTRHTHLAQHLSTFTTKPTFLGQLSIEQTLVEGQSYDICFEYIEEMIHKQEPFLSVLRLLVLFSITNGGLPKKHFDYLRRELLHSYGFEHMATLINLEKSGLFKKQDSKSNWVTVKRGLNLVVEDVDDANPNDIAYVFSGYAPLSIRLVQHALRAGWRSIEEIVRLLPGPHSERKQSLQSQEEAPASNDIGVVDGRRLLVLVVFIGGVTFAEISALRFLSAQEGMTYDLIIGTTKIINGSSLLETLIDVLP